MRESERERKRERERVRERERERGKKKWYSLTSSTCPRSWFIRDVSPGSLAPYDLQVHVNVHVNSIT